MRELREEELAAVHGGATSVRIQLANYLDVLEKQSFSADKLLHREYSALRKLRPHTLMDQMSVDS